MRSMAFALRESASLACSQREWMTVVQRQHRRRSKDEFCRTLSLVFVECRTGGCWDGWNRQGIIEGDCYGNGWWKYRRSDVGHECNAADRRSSGAADHFYGHRSSDTSRAGDSSSSASQGS